MNEIILDAFQDELEKIAGVKRLRRLTKALDKAKAQGPDPTELGANPKYDEILNSWSVAHDKWGRRVKKDTPSKSPARALAMARYSGAAGIKPWHTGRQAAAAASNPKTGIKALRKTKKAE